MKTRQVLKMSVHGRAFSVQYKQDDPCNKYWLYKHTRKLNQYGYMTERRNLVVKYANMESCLLYLASVPEFHIDD